MTTAIIDPTGTPRIREDENSHRVISPTERPSMDALLDAHGRESEGTPEPSPFVQGSPSRPDPGIFKLQETGAIPPGTRVVIDPTGGPRSFSEAVTKVKELGASTTPRRRLTHNEMIEEIVGAMSISNQTKFYVIAKLGYDDAESTAKRGGLGASSFPPSEEAPPPTSPGKKAKKRREEAKLDLEQDFLSTPEK